MNAGRVLESVAASVGWAPASERLQVVPGAARVATSHPVSDMAAGAYGALALAAADYAGGAPTPVVDRAHAGVALAGNEYLTIDGAAPETWDPITGYYRCADERFVYLHANFPHLREGLLRLFGAENDRASMAARLSAWTAAGAEETAQAAGLCCMMTRSRAEWEAHPQRAALAAQPLIRIAEIGAGGRPPRRLDGRPLAGLRVLDLSRVIAGPMAGRALAELGAEVLRVSAPDLPHIPGLVVDTGFGKRAAFADLTTENGRAALRALAAEADVVIDGFRPGALAAKGFGPKALAALNPGVTVVTLSAFSDVGPWAGRRGYDSYVQGGVGLAAGAPPRRLPCQPLDYLTGCLCAFGAVVALTRRRETGGARLVEMSLARTAMWVWEMSDLLGPDTEAPGANIGREDAAARGWIRRMETRRGAVAALAPPYRFAEDPLDWAGPPPVLGEDPPAWR